MTISVMYTLICQGGHRCRSEAPHEETKRKVLAEGKAGGYKRVRVANGSYWDFCPECYARYRAEET